MDKIQELTSKLYLEGVEKGKEEANRIIAEAEAKAQEIVNNATARAKEINDDALKTASDLKRHTETELQLYGSQAVEALKSEITNLVTDRLATKGVTSATGDQNFMHKLIVELVQNWAKNESLSVKVENRKALEQYIVSEAKELINKGLKIEQVSNIKTGFVVSPQNGKYKVIFGEEEFINYFKEFLRPQVKKLLFD